MDKPIILTFSRYYLPGYKAGGPIRTISNMVEWLSDELQFKIITSDRDSGDTKAYSGIDVDCWNRVGKAEVYYCSPKNQNFTNFRKIINSTTHDILYLNSFFAPRFTILPLMLMKLKLIPQNPVILAPRGEFSPGALKIKNIKKRLYIWVVRFIKLYESVLWQASSKYEVADIRREFEKHSSIYVAQNLPPRLVKTKIEQTDHHKKVKGKLRLIFLSRISRKKNLDGALKILQHVKGYVEFDIYGPKEDEKYWQECKRLINSLPSEITTTYHGKIPHEKVIDVMRTHDIFFLPTHGENFGHVILEALLSGCPVIISDQTPWRNLEGENVGWDIPLSQPERFCSIIERCIHMNAEEYKQFSKNARRFALNVAKDRGLVEQNRKLFLKALEKINKMKQK